jgi:glycosyltransferase involved in cell wall biosynthesis
MPQPDRANRAPERTKIFLVCSGLGNVHRGYEAFMRDCFEVMRAEPAIDAWLFKGGGDGSTRDITVANLARESLGARVLGQVTRRGAYVVEQVTFALGLLHPIGRHRPDLVYYCDPSVGRVLWNWRRLTGRQFRLLFHNGGPHPAPFQWCDHVHQLTPIAATEADLKGHGSSRQTLIPCGIRMETRPAISLDERDAIRRLQGIPLDRPVVLSVGALNRGHKRMEYLVKELAALPEPRPFLVMLGQVESETPAVRATANLFLGSAGYLMRTVSRAEMDDYYRSADVFVLASLHEAFGLSYVEAMSHGLPCLAHDYPVARYVLGSEGYFGDFRRPGALAIRLAAVLNQPDSSTSRLRRHFAVKSRFGWAALAPEYVAMFERCVAEEVPIEPAPVRLEAPAEAS